MKFFDASASVEVMQYKNNCFHDELRWDIRLNSRLGAHGMFEAASGFFIEETEKSLDDDKEKTYTFDTEAGVIQHIVIKMTPRIGYHQQWESMSQRRKDEP